MTVALVALTVGGALGVAVWLWLSGRTHHSMYTTPESTLTPPLYAQRRRGWFAAWAAKFNRIGTDTQRTHLPGIVMLIIPPTLGVVGAVASGLPGAFFPITALAVVLPWMVLKDQNTRRTEALENQLVPFVDSLTKSLEGGTLHQAIRDAAQRVDPPLSHELARVLAQIDSGVPLTQALQTLAQRSESRALTMVCATLDMADRNGSPTVTTNLTEIASAISERQQLHRLVKAETVELRVATRMFAGIVGLATAGSMIAATEAWLSWVGAAGFIVALGSIAAQVQYTSAIQRRFSQAAR